MAGKPKLKAAFAELDRRGGPEALQEELLSGKTIPMIARELGLDRGYLQRNLMKNEEYGRAITEIEPQIADMQAHLALNDFQHLYTTFWHLKFILHHDHRKASLTYHTLLSPQKHLSLNCIPDYSMTTQFNIYRRNAFK